MSLDLKSNVHQIGLTAGKPVRPAVYEFEEFRLDSEHLMLSRAGEELLLTPRQVETLLALIEHRGEIVTKNVLMARVWGEAAVEESNLVQNIYVLRKILGNTSTGKPMIETLRRRGYRFNGELEAGKGVSTTDIRDDHSGPRQTGGNNARSRSRRVAFFAIAIAALIVIAVSGWFVKGGWDGREAPILTSQFASDRLSTDGKVFTATISPDGTFVVYAHGGPGESQTVWRRDLKTGHNTEIIKASNDNYYGLAISPDGKTLYFMRRPPDHPEGSVAYRMLLSGGIPEKVLDGPEGWLSISPNGDRIAFVRCHYEEDDYCSLWVADASDGANERMLVSRPRPYRIRDVDFSPDGSLIAYSTGQSENLGDDFRVAAVDPVSGATHELSPQRFFNISGLGWLPDQRSILIAAAKGQTMNYRIWKLDTKAGTAEPLTKDAEWYRDLSVDAAGTAMVSTNIVEKFPIRVMSLEDAKVLFTIPDGTSVSFGPDGRLFYRSSISGHHEIWSASPDGSERTQLTSDLADQGHPIISPDNNSIYFASNRTGSVHVWRMNADGSNQTQITMTAGGFPIVASPDGEWVYYHHGVDRTLWRVSVRSGEEVMVLDKRKNWFTVSFDGSRIAYVETVGGERFIYVVDSATGARQEALKVADQNGTVWELAWLPNDEGLAYIVSSNEFRKHRFWIHNFGGATQPRSIAEFDQEIGAHGLAISPHGNKFAISSGSWLHDAVLVTGLK
jgi:Tol biopolymer transport system component/DNA-binding winged helix-turn-helix (wHTH) protein